jgi:hypothetical protein
MLAGLQVVSFAQTSAAPMKFEYVFDIGGEPGFAIIQDRDGHLWFATREDGLIRRDHESGRFSQFKHDPDDSDSLPRMAIPPVFLRPTAVISSSRPPRAWCISTPSLEK